jgi:putative membrane protein
MPWYGAWDWGPWLIFPILMCVGMIVMMLLMARGHMGGCGGEHMDEAGTDAALETLRQRFASGELTRQEYEEQRKVLLTA